jgi:GNAT superfamily N-acetyltransferase
MLAPEAYDPATIESFIRHGGTMDPALLIEDGRVFVLELDGDIVGCCGWTSRAPSDGTVSLKPTRQSEPATIRSIFVDPALARQGLGNRIMDVVERDIAAAGFQHAGLAATLNAMPLCSRRGYRPTRVISLALPDGIEFKGVLMSKPLFATLAAAA